jgi:hypothetical protein
LFAFIATACLASASHASWHSAFAIAAAALEGKWIRSSNPSMKLRTIPIAAMFRI